MSLVDDMVMAMEERGCSGFVLFVTPKGEYGCGYSDPVDPKWVTFTDRNVKGAIELCLDNFYERHRRTVGPGEYGGPKAIAPKTNKRDFI